MNINPSGLKIYSANARIVQQGEVGALRKPDAQVKAAAPEKSDTISISREAENGRAIGKTASSVMQELRAMDDPARLDAIISSVRSGSYHVASGDLADAMLGVVARA